MTYPVVSLSVGRAAHQEFSSSDSGRMPDVRSDTRGLDTMATLPWRTAFKN